MSVRAGEMAGGAICGKASLRNTKQASARKRADEIDVLGKFYGQATKGVRWMPRRQKAKKDVASCEKPRGAASKL